LAAVQANIFFVTRTLTRDLFAVDLSFF